MTNFDLSRVKKVHFIGIGGIFMSSLAKYCLSLKKTVSGSDIKGSAMTEELSRLGAKITLNHAKENAFNKDMVVYTSAISEDNEELKEARRVCPLVVKRSEFLGKILKDYKKTVAISGSHGKTTTTAMIAKILLAAGYNPTVFLGGEDRDFANFYKGDNLCAVTEACEYKKNFLDLSAYLSVVLNIDNDHMESFNGESDLENSFREFIKGGVSLINADDKRCREISGVTSVFFGIENPAAYTAKRITENQNGYSFTLYAYRQKRGRITLKIPGRHNVYNALAAFAAADLLGVDFNSVKRALESFCGVKRRAEYLGKIKGVSFYADYAHHPKELSAAINTLCKGKTLVVFQPHTYSRTENLKEDFTQVLKEVSSLVIYKTYPAREKYSKKGSALTLYKRIKEENKGNTYYCYDKKGLERIIKNGDYSRVIFLGAGDIYDIAKSIIGVKSK